MIRRALVFALGLAVAGPCAAGAQQSPPGGADTGLVLEGSYRLSRLQGTSANMLGGAALLSVGRRFAFGLAGWALFRPMAVRRPGSVQDLGFAYGGAVGEMRLVTRAKYRAGARLLVGAGNAKLTDPVVGTEANSDNFGVLEPEVEGSLSLWGPIRLSAALGYRVVFGVQDLSGIGQRDLRGWTTRLSLSLHTF